MNYSDYDSDGYSSNEDEDYVPSDDNLSEDDMNECVKEDALEGEDDDAQRSEHVKTKKKKAKANIPMRKRKKGGLKLEGDGEGGSADQQKENNEEKQKKKADDLWASFLSDVGPRPQAAAPSTGSQQSTSTSGTDKPSKPSTTSRQQEDKPKESSKITITKVFDFAGEEVRVTKEVDADSREAKSFLKNEEKALKQKEEVSEPQASVPLSSESSVILRLNAELLTMFRLASRQLAVPGRRVSQSSRYNECMLTEVRVRYHAPSPPDTSEHRCRVLRLPANVSDKTRPLFTPLASKNVPWPERDQATQFPKLYLPAVSLRFLRAPSASIQAVNETQLDHFSPRQASSSNTRSLHWLFFQLPPIGQNVGQFVAPKSYGGRVR
ncbi:Craniofacial development protein 1 [Labeo rohita]|uniref:Craniofacial development protein 1 n=1 Tax=Labeo rohita TaxID=84645 RepID=A0ABQ8LTI4_LABRO|nr:Craniofacial development protein 1 [Labeo rohita]